MGTGEPLQLDNFPLRERLSRWARCIRIDVRPSGEVVLTIPRGASRTEALAFVARRRDWIERTRSRLMARAQPQAEMLWDGFDTLPLRGHSHSIAVSVTSLRKAAIRITPGCIQVLVPALRFADAHYKRRSLMSALLEEARRDAQLLLDEESLRLGLSYSSFSIRDQKTRWGSCSPDGHISLNWRLVMAPREVFRYVVVHELCHLRWLSHGPRFWGLVKRQMPDYELQRAWLRRHGDELHARLRMTSPEPVS